MKKPVEVYLYHSVLSSKVINLIKGYSEMVVRKYGIIDVLNYYNMKCLIVCNDISPHLITFILLRGLYTLRMILIWMNKHLMMVGRAPGHTKT